MTPLTGVEKHNGDAEFSFGNFRLWPDGTFFRDESQIHLPPKELAALRFLLAHAGQVVTPGQLKHAIWGDVHVTSDSVPRCMSALRACLEPDDPIQTVYKRGYRFVGRVRHHDDHARPVCRLAVMPFAAGHNVPEHLGFAVAEEVTSRLAAHAPAWISILARDSVFTLARRGLTAVQVGETLKADQVLSGTLLAMPTQYRLRVETIRVHDGTEIWVEDILGSGSQLMDLESSIVQRLIFRFCAENMPGAGAKDANPVHPDAYQLYLLGHQEWQTHERYRMQDAMNHLVQATELDPSLLPAHIDLAELCLTQEFYGFLAPDAAARQVRRIADTVHEMAEIAPGFLPLVGWVKFHVDRDLAGALDLFFASAHLPHSSATTRLRVAFALSRHRFEEALECLEAALVVDPYASWLYCLEAWTYHLAGQRAKSVETIKKAMELFPNDLGVHSYAAMILAYNGEADHATRLAESLVQKAPYFDVANAVWAYALAANGQRDEAHEILERLQWLSRERFVLRSFLPAAFAALGDREEAVSELKAADACRCPWFFQMLADPRLEALHGHPEFERMRQSLGELEASESFESRV